MLDLLLPWAFALGLLIPMRSLEHWLHQHMFKVGWLLTKNLQTTTILFYTFFLPGVVLNEVLIWLVAGVLNVRAEGAIKMPEKQEIAELKLNFIKLDKKVSAFKLAVISIAPLIGGIVFIWFVTNNIFDISGFLDIASSGQIEDIRAAFSRLLATPDFWLWMYLVFSVSAVMMPDPGTLRGWRLVIPPIVVVFILLYAIGVGDRILLVTLQSLSQGAYFLIGTFGAVIVVHLVMTGILGAIESIIERITGDSATFEKGKLVAMRREEILKMRAEQAAKAQKSLAIRGQPAAEKSKTSRAGASGPPSIYRLPLPIPGTPDKEGLLTPEVTVKKEPQGALPPAAATAPVINPPRSIPTIGASATSPTQSSSEPAASTSESPRVPDAARPGDIQRPPPFTPSSPAKPAASADTSELPATSSPRPADTARPAPFAPASPPRSPDSPRPADTQRPAETVRPSPFAPSSPPKPADATAEVPAVGASGASGDKPASTPFSRPAPSTFGQPNTPARPAGSPFGARPPLDDDEEDEGDFDDDDDGDEDEDDV